MAKLCLCLTAKTISRNLEILNKYRRFTDMAELRVDCLEDDERLYVRRFPELAGLPVILTIRRDVDGGKFVSGEGARVKLLARGLAFASADSRLNFAYVDIEDDFNVPSLEEAARTFGTKIIRSYHNLSGIIDNIPAKIKSMRRSEDEIVKVAITANSTADVLSVYRASKTCHNIDKILICMGHYGICSRILAERFGSYLCYTSPLSEKETFAAPGQLDIRDLVELYRFRKINKKTKIYSITGYPLKASVSPWFFNTIFGLENTDAVYVPFPTNSITSFMDLAREMDIKGIVVTVPYKESVLSGLSKCSPEVLSIGACNTMSRYADGWLGENTDCVAFSNSLLGFLQKKNLKWKKVTIVGAGGIARAVAAEVYRLGGKALILNRTVHKAMNIASQYKFKWGGLDSHGIEQMSKYNDIIIQTTSAEMEDYDNADPLKLYNFTGKETVMDLIYIPAETAFLKRAAAAGCKTINGYDMVVRQVCIQYASFTGKEIPQKLLSKINNPGANVWNKIRTG
jgi:3-dehydroquinate dehydratase/shikimate dehydrogenase